MGRLHFHMELDNFHMELDRFLLELDNFHMEKVLPQIESLPLPMEIALDHLFYKKIQMPRQ